MRTFLLFLMPCVLALVGGCSKSPSDPAEDAFKEKFDALRIGMTQADVHAKLGEPTTIKSQIEEDDASFQSPTGPIQLHKGDTTTIWSYDFSLKHHNVWHYTLWFATKDTNNPSTGVLFMQNVISVGDPIRIK